MSIYAEKPVYIACLCDTIEEDELANFQSFCNQKEPK